MMIDSHENEDKEHHQDWEGGEKAINGHWPLSYIRIRKKERGRNEAQVGAGHRFPKAPSVN